MFCNSNSNRYNIKKKTTKDRRRSGIISQPIKYDEDDVNIIHYPKTKGEENLIRAALEENEFLSNILQGRRLQNFIDCMYVQGTNKGEVIINQGEVGSRLYISRRGTFEVTIHGDYISSFKDVRVFGELAILYSAKRYATIKSLDDGALYVLDCPVFQKLIVKSAIEEQEEMASFLMKVPKLNAASKEKLYQVANLLRIEFFPTSTTIVKQGDIGDKFYVIRAGSVTVTKNDQIVAQLSKGQFFGELALLKDEFRQATVTADAPGIECLTLTRKQFVDHFGNLEEFINLKVQSIGGVANATEFTDIDFRDFMIITTLGIGGFGRVELVQHRSYKDQVFALKYMKKIEILGEGHQDQVYNEKNLQMACNSPFIVRLYRTYRDPKYIYLLLEVCLGGDLWNLLHRQNKRCFEEAAAKFYAGCVLEALAYLHGLGIIYRDLKPENVMIDRSGYVKLTDFGFAKKNNPKEKTYTFVGTAEYVAPEIILHKGHNKGVDFWAFGVFIFELLVGRTPFRTADPAYHLKTYKVILKGIDNVVFPYFMSQKARSLVKKLCMPVSADRLGCQKAGIKDVRSHVWFSSLNWSKLRSFQLTPPFKPALDNNIDTKYFEKFKEDRDVPVDDNSNWDEEF